MKQFVLMFMLLCLVTVFAQAEIRLVDPGPQVTVASLESPTLFADIAAGSPVQNSLVVQNTATRVQALAVPDPLGPAFASLFLSAVLFTAYYFTSGRKRTKSPVLKSDRSSLAQLLNPLKTVLEAYRAKSDRLLMRLHPNSMVA